MERLFSAVGGEIDPRKGGGDTFVDRLNCRYTPLVLVILALLITTKIYVGEPIACWCPDHFTKSQVDYTNQVCWVYNTYYLPYTDSIPRRGARRDTIGYYQWVSLVLCLMGVVFTFPRILWRTLSTKSGVSVCSLTDAAIDCQIKMDNVERDKTVQFMTKHMGRFLADLARSIVLASKRKTFFLRMYGNYLVFILLFVKMVYFCNVIGQLFLLNYFLGTKYNLYGIEVLERLVDGKTLSDSRRFPRVTMCDLEIRVMGNVQPYTVMCALPVNLFNEIIFIFVWFWLVAVAIATIASLLYWLITCIVVPHEVKFIKSRLIAMDKLGAAPDHMVESFVNNYLRNDGILIIQLVAENASDIVAAELICGLWDHYRSNKKNIEHFTVHDTDFNTDSEDEEMNNKNPKFTFDRGDSDKSPDDDDGVRKRPPPPEPWNPHDSFKRPPIPPKPNLDDVDYKPTSVTGRVPFRLPQTTFDKDKEKLRKEKLEREKKEKELKKDRDKRR